MAKVAKMAKLAKVAKVAEVAKIAKVEAGRGGLWWRDFRGRARMLPSKGRREHSRT